MKKIFSMVVMLLLLIVPSILPTTTVSAVVTVDADLKYFETIQTATDIYLLPQQIWHRSGEYAGYLTKTYVEYNRNGIWYGTYTGYLRKGPFESYSIMPFETE